MLYERLAKETTDARATFMELPLVTAILGLSAQKASSRDSERREMLRHVYRRFLEESYHHVRAAAKVYALAGSRVDEGNEPFREWLLQHAVDEYGHHEWILNDLRALGVDPADVTRSKPSPACAALVGYMYYVAGVDNPIGILGDSYVIEGLSQLFATQLAGSMKDHLGLGDDAVTYLERHGQADQAHMEEFKILVDSHIRRDRDLTDIIHVSRVEFQLYGWIVQELQAPSPV
jgi:pyrroloquinoline quinone (PQQ) biosynthesis protein C